MALQVRGNRHQKGLWTLYLWLFAPSSAFCLPSSAETESTGSDLVEVAATAKRLVTFLWFFMTKTPECRRPFRCKRENATHLRPPHG